MEEFCFACYTAIVMISRWESVAGYILFDVFGSVIHFPFWWYGNGLFAVVEWGRRGIVYRWRSYALGLWMRQFFVPMYHAYDWSGRLISVLVRFLVIIGRLFALALEACAYLVLIILWVFAPIVFAGMLIANVRQSLSAASAAAAI
jgi:hypothetical protein